MRRLLTVAALGAVLVLLFFIQQQIKNWHYVVSGEPGQLLYASAFDDPATSDWQQYDGRVAARVADGRVVVSNGVSNNVAFSVADPYFADFDLRAEAQAINGPLDNGYGVVFRYIDPENFYLFLVSSDGYYEVTRVLGGVQRDLSAWVDSELVHQGLNAINHLRVVARGNQFTFYVNDAPVQLCIPSDPEAISTYRSGLGCIGGTMQDTLTDASLPIGKVGVAAMSLGEPDVEASFDNLTVYSPEAGA
ncbi:MAG: hypothetical protein IT320_05635 [Anaerolineae bacterium]|nr:hypothetical protein [Anaerolineae bacterium]